MNPNFLQELFYSIADEIKKPRETIEPYIKM